MDPHEPATAMEVVKEAFRSVLREEMEDRASTAFVPTPMGEVDISYKLMQFANIAVMVYKATDGKMGGSTLERVFAAIDQEVERTNYGVHRAR